MADHSFKNFRCHNFASVIFSSIIGLILLIDNTSTANDKKIGTILLSVSGAVIIINIILYILIRFKQRITNHLPKFKIPMRFKFSLSNFKNFCHGGFNHITPMLLL